MKAIRSESKFPTEFPTANSVVKLLVTKSRPTENSVTNPFRPTIGHRIGKIFGQFPTDRDRIFGHNSLLCDRICDRIFGPKFCWHLVQQCDRNFGHKIRSQITIPTEVHSTATENSVTVFFPTEVHRIVTENSVTIQLSD